MFTEINLHDLETDIWDVVIKITEYLTPLETFVNIVTCQPAVGLRGRGCAAERC
jgi:hypothetical protein